MDRQPIKKKTTNTMHRRIDRFVMSRETVRELSKRRSWPIIEKDPNTDIWFSKYLQQKKYASYLNKSFGLTPPKHQERDVNTYTQLHPDGVQVMNMSKQTWPCIPRHGKYLTIADSILDLPNYKDAIFPELLDWNCDNILVAALGRFYFKWSWKTQALINQGATKNNILCCKFHPKGKYLALGRADGMVDIHDSDLGKSIDTKCCLQKLFGGRCSITAVEWSPTGNSYVIGCSREMLCSFSMERVAISYARVPIRGAILQLRISPDARFLAVVTVDSSTVCLLTWPDLKHHSDYVSEWTVKAITWHPWRSALLAVGGVTDDIKSRLLLWDVHAKKYQEYPIGCNNYYLDTMLFNSKSGELVVTLWSPDSTNMCRLVVMSDPKTAVDLWEENNYVIDRIRHIIFNSDGTLLATATAEEDLIIWNFLPENTKSAKLKTFFSMPVFLDKATTGFTFR